MLSTPPAFILSQDQTLMLKFWFQSKFAWLILTVITVVWFFAKFAFCSSRSTRSCLQAVMDSFLSRMFWMFSWTSRLNQKPLFLEFSGFYILFSFQGSLLLSHWQLIYITTISYLCQQLFYFIFRNWAFAQQLEYHIIGSCRCQLFFLNFQNIFANKKTCDIRFSLHMQTNVKTR